MPDDPELLPHVPEAMRFNDLLRTYPKPDFSTKEGIAAARRNIEGTYREPALPVTERQVPGGPPVRVIVPDRVNAAYLHLHAGGWIAGTAQMADVANAVTASECGLAVVSVDYRLAPEHPYPAAVDDCVAAARCLAEEAQREFGTARLLIGGESAGATLAVHTLLRLRGEVEFAAANLVYGGYDMSVTLPSQRDAADTLMIDRSRLEVSRPLIFPGLSAEERRDPGISPIWANLEGLPPALFSVGALDPLLDDSLLLGARWQAAGGTAWVDVYPESPHGFTMLPTGMAAVANTRIHNFLRGHAVSPAPPVPS